MSPLGIGIPIAAAKSTGYQIGQSLRFNSGDTHYLNRTPGSAGNRRTWTWSGWFKRTDVSASTGNFTVFAAQQPSGSDQDGLVIDADGSFYILFYSSDPGGSNNFYYRSNRLLRDPSAWYHIMFVLDTTQAAVDDRCNVWINNEKVVDINTANRSALAQNFEAAINNTGSHTMGKSVHASDPGDGYLAEVNFIDGTAYTDATAFGKYDANGVWTPVGYAGSYTGNSFYLKFASGDGTDSSGLSNTWTANNFTTSGTGTDVMSDTPTDNYCTLNPLDNAGTLAEGNLKFTASGNQAARATFEIPGSGKWYAEGTTGNASTATQGVSFGLATSALSLTASPLNTGNYTIYSDNIGRLIVNGTAISTSLGTFAAGTVLQFAYDSATGKGWFGKNNTWYDSSGGATGDPATGANATFTTTDTLYPFAQCYGNYVTANFGQRAFAYTPPTGFKALNTSNLPAPTIKDGSDYFNTVLWSGNGATDRDITGVGFAPDLVWAKDRSGALSHVLQDRVRGAGNTILQSNSTATETAQGTANGYIDNFTADGFETTSSNANQNYYFNSGSDTYVAWNWLAGNGTSSNTNGSITSTVSANPSAGFSIVRWSNQGTVGHGLGVAPSFIIVKSINQTSGWWVYATALGNSNYGLPLHSTAAQNTGINWGGAPTSTVFYISPGNGALPATSDNIAYCFAEVEGYSKFGSYTGNGSTDGVFIHTGFKVAWWLVKRTDSTESWYIRDTTRDDTNPISIALNPNAADGEGSYGSFDFLSNGIKIRESGTGSNTSGGTYIYAAFAENPFGGSGVSPATAR